MVGIGRGNKSILSALGGEGGGGGGGGGESGETEGSSRDVGKEEDTLQSLSVTSSGLGDVLLVDGLQLLVEEKEVEPEALPGADILSSTSPDDQTPRVNLAEDRLSTSDILKCECLFPLSLFNTLGDGMCTYLHDCMSGGKIDLGGGTQMS